MSRPLGRAQGTAGSARRPTRTNAEARRADRRRAAAVAVSPRARPRAPERPQSAHAASAASDRLRPVRADAEVDAVRFRVAAERARRGCSRKSIPTSCRWPSAGTPAAMRRVTSAARRRARPRPPSAGRAARRSSHSAAPATRRAARSLDRERVETARLSAAVAAARRPAGARANGAGTARRARPRPRARRRRRRRRTKPSRSRCGHGGDLVSVERRDEQDVARAQLDLGECRGRAAHAPPPPSADARVRGRGGALRLAVVRVRARDAEYTWPRRRARRGAAA